MTALLVDSTNSAFRRELVACAAIVRHVGYARANKGSNWLTWLFFAIAILAPVVAIAFGAPWDKAVGLGVGIPASLVATLWWMQLVASLLEQNASHARLVPRMQRRSMAVLTAAFGAAVALITALFWLAGAQTAYVAVSAVLWLLLMTACIVNPYFCIALLAVVLGPSLLKLDVYPSSPEMLLACAASLCLFIGAVIWRALGGGVPGWWRANTGVWSGPEMLAIERAYGRSLQRACTARDRGALLLHCLGPQAHARPLVGFLLPLAIGAGAVAAVHSGSEALQKILTLVFPISVIGGQLLAGRAMLAAVSARRREQAMFVLAAQRPDTGALNRLLACGLVRQYVRSWLPSAALVLIFSAAIGGDAGRLLGMLTACVAGLAFAPFLLRDFAGADAEKGATGVVTVLPLCAGTVVIMAVIHQPGPLVWAVCAAAGMAAVLLHGWLRWRALLRAQAARFA